MDWMLKLQCCPCRAFIRLYVNDSLIKKSFKPKKPPQNPQINKNQSNMPWSLGRTSMSRTSLFYFMTASWLMASATLVCLSWDVLTQRSLSVILAKLPVHMAWPGAAKERMSIQRLGGTVGPDYEWHWPGQIWVTKTNSRAGEPHARWRSLAKVHLWLIFSFPDGLHLRQWHWPSFVLGWENVSSEVQREDQMFLTLYGKRLKGVRG